MEYEEGEKEIQTQPRFKRKKKEKKRKEKKRKKKLRRKIYQIKEA